MQTLEKEGLVALIELYINSLKAEQQDGKDHFDEFATEVVKLKDLGVVSEQDILKLQDKKYLGLSKFIELTSYLRKNTTSGLTYNEALDLEHKIQFAALSYAQENGLDSRKAFIESMKPHESGIDQIFDGTYDKKKLALLKSLPSVSAWDHKLGADAWQYLKP